jgi:hypothetical protein
LKYLHVQHACSSVPHLICVTVLTTVLSTVT